MPRSVGPTPRKRSAARIPCSTPNVEPGITAMPYIANQGFHQLDVGLTGHDSCQHIKGSIWSRYLATISKPGPTPLKRDHGPAWKPAICVSHQVTPGLHRCRGSHLVDAPADTPNWCLGSSSQPSQDPSESPCRPFANRPCRTPWKENTN